MSAWVQCKYVNPCDAFSKGKYYRLIDSAVNTNSSYQSKEMDKN